MKVMLQNTQNLWIGGNSEGKWKGKDKDLSKFNRAAKIQKIYPEIDHKLRSFCLVKSLTERKASAFAVLMMIETGIRIGNEDSAEGYVSKTKKTEGQVLKTYGLTTLQNEHIEFPEDGTMVLDFVGKKSVEHKIVIKDKFLVEIGKQFWIQNKNRWLTLSDDRELTDYMVNKFVKKSINSNLSAKDFRTFKANIEAAKASNKVLSQSLENPKKKEVSEEIKKVVEKVSTILGNTPGISKKAYINPQILHHHWMHRGFNVEVISRKGKKKEIITKQNG